MNGENQGKPSGRLLRSFRAPLKGNRTTLAALLGIGMYSFVGSLSYSAADGGEQRNESTTAAAINNFWAIYHGNQYDEISEAQAELAAAIQHDTGNPTLYALLGATHFWHVGEASRDRHPNPSVLAKDMPTAARYSERPMISTITAIT
jgi:hypothetical protein